MTQTHVPHFDDFRALVIWCMDQPELVENFNRLTRSSLGEKISPIAQLIDGATGKSEEELSRFIGFVKDCFWDRLPQELFVEDSNEL